MTSNEFKTPPAKAADFLVSAVRPAQFPEPGLFEVALLGRSNSGKSSLINRWLGRKALAKVGAAPGRTRQINFFRISWNKDSAPFYVADLPGYGFAAAPKDMVESWRRLVESYLGASRPGRRALLLMDIRRSPQDEEHQILKYLADLRIPVLLVATKADKVSAGQLSARLMAIKKEMGLARLPVAFSAISGLGREQLVTLVSSDSDWGPEKS